VVALVALAPALGGCGGVEPRALRLTVRVDPTMPAFDYVQVSLGYYVDSNQFGEESFQLQSTEFDTTGAYEVILFIDKRADSLDVLAEAHAGTLIIGHGRRTAVTLHERWYDLEVEVTPHPGYTP
jgi:hypothetical protein